MGQKKRIYPDFTAFLQDQGVLARTERLSRTESVHCRISNQGRTSGRGEINKFKHALLQGVWNLMPIYLIAKSTVKSTLRGLCKKGQFDELPSPMISPRPMTP